MREVLSVEEYLAELLAQVAPDARQEQLSLSQAGGATLATAIASPVSIPVFDNSAMDGYAVRFHEAADAPVRLRVVGDVPAGSAEDPVAGPGECVRIMTGAPVPGFADTVVPVEDTDGGLSEVAILRAPTRPGTHVRRAGEDIAAGTTVAEPGAVLTAGVIGALAACGVTSVAVRPRPKVAVCATGDELVADGSALLRGQIYESNGPALAAALSRDGAEVLRSDPARDDPAALVAWLDAVAAGVDLVVLTGGVSVGAYDVVRDVLTRADGVFRHVRVQPGRPQGWAHWQGTMVVALPGNPLSAALSYEVFVRPLLDRLLGRSPRPDDTAVAALGWASPKDRRQLVPVRLTTGPDGRLLATPSHVRGSASHTVTSLAAADGFAMVAEDVTEVRPGDLLAVRWRR